MNYEYSKHLKNSEIIPSELEKIRKEFLDTIAQDDVGFFNIELLEKNIARTSELVEKFSDKEHFFQIGIGGSALGPEMLVQALSKKSHQFTFINNIDPDKLFEQLANKDLSKSLFYIVSKSGSTAETMALYFAISNELKQLGIKEDAFKNYFVFCTENKESELKSISTNLSIDCLDIPINIGGRFSVLTNVGLFPAIFAGINVSKLFLGARKLKNEILENKNHELFNIASKIITLEKNGISQTVLMPYSSKLREFSYWFTQLWAESLGKIKGEGFTGLTPIPAYGATDQHSQMQLFMQGPRDKLMIFIQVKNHHNDYDLNNQINAPRSKMLSKIKLSRLLEAEFEATLMAFNEVERPFINLALETLDEETLGQLILFFECLTVSVGNALEIDPFNQPGVELAKVYTFKSLS